MTNGKQNNTLENVKIQCDKNQVTHAEHKM